MLFGPIPVIPEDLMTWLVPSSMVQNLMSGWWFGTFFRWVGIPPTKCFCQFMSEFWTSLIFLIEDAQGD